MSSAGYSGTPLAKKLGIKPSARVALVTAPAGLEAQLGPLPEGASLKRRAGHAELTLWFVTRNAELRRRVARMAEILGRDGIWIAWPKKGSRLATDVTQNDVRHAGLDHGLVDFKICAIDEDWSALKFQRRKS